ncbi:3-oxoacyl-ACP reductase FabG [Lysinibacillus odysseyi]|uniref:3-oxoacyl-ACP synthase n=1 Tax=Lysinibacillus odysseyi 34hs-1 = NBRC 100172 TaxID=1220589 RepID=A0A0A3IFQ7_9BACI|nr:3-oxoacyl-ACP reductase FabG [Lysinibacillus odysseyi]KGR82265.1 3-oxoacyl-ACP synthase [Lysinibacillus odysseyi 34hs-1 = NBRC 100172]
MRLKDKVAIITGGAGGIGLAAVQKFVEEGAYVVIADYNKTAGIQVQERFVGEERPVLFIQTDTGERTSVESLVNKTIEKYGRIDILVNNAGTTKDAMLVKMTEQQFDDVININLKGVFNCTQCVIPYMITQGSGKIINTSSVSGVYGNVGQTNYAASKAALIGMTKTWAKEFGRKGIHVNAVAPGFTLTPMVQKMPEEVLGKMEAAVSLRRLGKPEDIANAYLFLASSESDYITGHVLHVDGGIVM